MRYSRNLNVEHFTESMQELLSNSSVLVVGAGGLGSAVISYLVMAGVGHIGVVEFDTVSESNLQRQIIYNESDVGESKGELAIKYIESKNSRCQTILYNTLFTHENGADIAKGYNLIIDCSDNYEARYAMDSISQQLGIPFIYGSAEQLGGQISTFNSSRGGSYRELFGECAQTKSREVLGVLSPIPGIIGSIQALEAVKLLTGMSGNLSGKLLVFDGKNYETTILDI